MEEYVDISIQVEVKAKNEEELEKIQDAVWEEVSRALVRIEKIKGVVFADTMG